MKYYVGCFQKISEDDNDQEFINQTVRSIFTQEAESDAKAIALANEKVDLFGCGHSNCINCRGVDFIAKNNGDVIYRLDSAILTEFQVDWSADIEDGDEDINRGHLDMEPFIVETSNADTAIALAKKILVFAEAVGYEHDRVSNRTIDLITDEPGKVVYSAKKKVGQNE